MSINDTKIAPRRLPFPIGTKMFFYQSAAPIEWTIDATDNDRFLRVRSTVGGATAGPLNTVTATNPNLTHTHTTNSHTHGLQSHTHPFGVHTHDFPNGDGFSTTDGMANPSARINNNYRIRDDGSGWTNQSTVGLAVDGGSGTEGHHNHWMGNTSQSNTANVGTPQVSSVTASSNATTGSSSPSLATHSHSINANYRPAYVDCIKATLTG